MIGFKFANMEGLKNDGKEPAPIKRRYSIAEQDALFADRLSANGGGCPVQAAWNDGNSAARENAGFFLVLMLDGGSVVRGPALQPVNGVVAILDPEDTNRNPTYVRCSMVASAMVEL